MRTTLDLDDDVLAAAKAIARRENRTAGQVVSDLARSALQSARKSDSDEFLGFRPLPPTGHSVTNELVDALRDELGV